MRKLIVAPHGDDEIIGCSTILDNECDVVFIDGSRESEIKASSKFFGFSFVVSPGFNRMYWVSREVYVPDPFNEEHPLHRRVGMFFYSNWLSKFNFFNLYFYTTKMNTFYTQEVPDSSHKRSLLDLLYPSQLDLWEFDHKYFLFEGRIKICSI